MPRVPSKPLTADPALVASIQSEVAEESRPLLQFITANARYLIGVVVILLVALIGTAIYRQVIRSQRESTLEDVARVLSQPASENQIAQLEALGKSCPEFMRTAVAVALVQSAVAQGKTDKAAEGYETVARADFDTSLGLAAALNQAGSLMKLERYAEAVRVLQSLLPRLGNETGFQARMMLAEAAVRAGQPDLAAATYEEMAGQTAVAMEQDYCRTRARDIRAAAAAEKESARPAAR